MKRRVLKKMDQLQKQNDSTNTNQNMEELHKDNEPPGRVQTNIRAILERQLEFDMEQREWREKERILEKKLSEYEANAKELTDLRAENEALRLIMANVRSHHVQSENALQLKVKNLESQVTQLQQRAQEDCPQRTTVDSTCTREIEVQTDFTMEAIDAMEHDVVNMAHLLREKRKDKTNATKSQMVKGDQQSTSEMETEKEKALEKALHHQENVMQKDCDELKELKETLKEHVEMQLTMEQKVHVLEKEHESLRKTVEVLKEELTQKDDLQAENAELRGLVESTRADCVQMVNDLNFCCGKLEEKERNKVNLETELRQMEKRALEAETQLKKAQEDMVQMEKAFQEDRAEVQSIVEKALCDAASGTDRSQHMFQDIENQLHNLQEDHAELQTTVDNLKGQRAQEGNANVFGDIQSGTRQVTEVLISELRQEVATLMESLQREKEKAWLAQQKSWEDQRNQWMNRVNELSEAKTRIFAMYEDEKEKTAKLEKKAEEMSRKRDQEKQEADRRYDQQLEHWRQREDEALKRISELTQTKKQLETELKEAHEKDKEQRLREGQWNEAREQLLQQIEVLRATNELNKRKKESRGFFSKVFGRSR